MIKTPGLKKALLEEPWAYFIAALILAFLSQTFSHQMSSTYSMLLLAGVVMWMIAQTQKKTILFFNTVSGNTGKSFGIAVIAFAAFIAISVLAIGFLQGAAQLSDEGLQDRLMKTTIGASQPILEENSLAIFFIGTFLIPYLETIVLIAYPIAFFALAMNMTLNLRSFRTWALLVFVAVIGMIFHFQAKGVTDGVALLLTFIFWLVSGFLIVKYRESESAVYLHIINNGWVLWRVIL